MEGKSYDGVYTDWVHTWRKWKNAWCESGDPVVQFCIQVITRDRKYTPENHAEFTRALGETVGLSRVNRDSTITVSTGLNVLSTISSTLRVDEFGIVTFKLSLFPRRDILRVVLCLENLGYGVIHDGGRVFSRDYIDSQDSSQKRMPLRDDPVWRYVLYEK